MSNSNIFGKYNSENSRSNRTFFLKDTKKNRKDLISRSRTVLDDLLGNLASNYISEVIGPNYSLILYALAKESGFLRLSAEDVLADNHYKTLRNEFLYRNLGYLIHGNDVQFQIPENFSDQNYRNFLLGALKVLLQGSTSKSIEEGSALFLDSPAKVVELFLQSDPRVENANFDISDQFKWRYDIEVSDFNNPSGFNLNDLKEGLEGLTEIIRPAHTLYDIRLIFKESFNIGQEGCRTLLDSNGYFRASKVTRNNFLKNYKKGINENILIGKVQQNNPSLFIVDGTPVVIPSAIPIQDVYKRSLSLLDLNRNDILVIEGQTVNPLVEGGFVVKQKQSEGEFCASDHFDHFEWDYEDIRFCCFEKKTVVSVTKEKIYNPGVPGNKIFQTNQAPIVVENNGSAELADSPLDVDVYVGGFKVPVLDIHPLEGKIVLKNAPPINAKIEITYKYFVNPQIPFTLNTFGSVLNGGGPYLSQQSIEYPVGSGYHPSSYGIQHQTVFATPENYESVVPNKCDPIRRTYSWEGFSKRYSALLNNFTSFRLNTIDPDNPNHHRLNSFHIVTDQGTRGNKIGGENPDFNDRTPQPTIEQSLKAPTPTFFKTFEMKGRGDNLQFTDEDTLNGDSEINEDFNLNSATNVEIVETPDRNQYSLDFEVTEEGSDNSLTPACDLDDFNVEISGEDYSEEFKFPPQPGEQIAPLVLNFMPMKAIAFSPVERFEIDEEELLKSSLNNGLLSFNLRTSQEVFPAGPRASQINVIETVEDKVLTNQFETDYELSSKEVHEDSYLTLVNSNNVLILNSFETTETVVAPASPIKVFGVSSGGYINEGFTTNSTQSIINQDADVVGSNPPVVNVEVVVSNSSVLNSSTLASFASVTGGLKDELVSVQMDGGNPWANLTKETEELD